MRFADCGESWSVANMSNASNSSTFNMTLTDDAASLGDGSESSLDPKVTSKTSFGISVR